MSEINESELLYDEKIEQEVFKEILDALTFIEPEFISREDYKKLEGNILKKIEYSESEEKENKNSIDRKDYKLFLPENITNNDKIEIYNFLENKFSEELGFITGERKIKAKIFYAVQDILNKENNENIGNNLEENQDYKQIEKLYKKIFGEENIPNISEVKDFLSSLTQKEKLEFRRDYINLARKIKNGENISGILDSEIDFHFEELFFRHGVNNLRFGLKIMTQGEQALLEEKKGEKIRKKETLQEEEKLLREEIDIDKYKKELEEVRNTGDKEKITEKELEAANAIIKSLYKNFPYQLSKEKYGGNISKIQQSKELYCIGFSIVGHTFLEELGIKHKGLYIPGHSALEVNIGGEKYYFDATGIGELIEFKELEKKGVFSKINIMVNGKQQLIYSGNTEKILLSQIYNNKGTLLSDLGREEEAIKLYNKSIYLNKNYLECYIHKGNSLGNLGKYEYALDTYSQVLEIDKDNYKAMYSKGNVLYKLGRYDEALNEYKNSINEKNTKLYLSFKGIGKTFAKLGNYESAIKTFENVVKLKPDNNVYFDLGLALEELGKYDEAIKNYDESIKLEPNFVFAYTYKGDCLNRLKKYEESLKWYNKALKLKPNSYSAYGGKGNSLMKLGKDKISDIYYDTADLIEGENMEELSDYKNEQEIIKTFIKNKNFEGLRDYLLELEKE